MSEEMNNQTSTEGQGGDVANKGNSAMAIILIIIVVALGAYMLMNRADNDSEVMPAQDGDVINIDLQDSNMIEEEVMMDEEGDEEANVRTIMISATDFAFSPSDISVNLGDTVRIILDNEQGFHDFVIDEYNVATSQFMGPGTEEIEFVADKAGEFEFYCSVGEHREMGMKGTLIVE